MFNVNEYVVYKGSGVCRIIDIGTLDFGGMDKEKKFYFLRPVHAKESITYAPVDNAKVPMRKVLS
ncbi:MAG TPA: CarD family transcriptional regulator, partial [Lachnospiraceae bacterium]|nr:CarD family transcriptional regulator [Lachnospiraceae bacterium]